MNDCKHQGGFSSEYSYAGGAGQVYIVRCVACQTAIGVVQKDLADQIKKIQNTVNSIEATVIGLS